MAEKIFIEGKFTDNYVELLKDSNNIVWMVRYNIDNSDYDSILEFCTLVKNAFENAKLKGGIFHSQYVSKNDWDLLLKNDDRWDIIEKENNNDIYHIQCDIDDAPICIIEAFFEK